MLRPFVFYVMYFQVLEYTSRDYIKNWYREISDDDKFLLEIRQCVTALCILCHVFSGFRVHIKGLY